MTPGQPEVQITIRSRFVEIDLVDSLSEGLLRSLHFDEVTIERISLAVREATANAIQHGNGPNSDQLVSIRFQVEKQELAIEVADKGKGFDLDAVPDPLAAENLLKRNGRGILLMRSYTDDVEFAFQNGGGTVVTMRKRIPAAPEDGTDTEENN